MSPRRRVLPSVFPIALWTLVALRQYRGAPESYSLNFDGRHDLALADLARDEVMRVISVGVNPYIGLGTHAWGTIRWLDPISMSFVTLGPRAGARLASLIALVLVTVAARVWLGTFEISRATATWGSVTIATTLAGGDLVPVIFPDLSVINTTFPMYAVGGLLLAAAVRRVIGSPRRRTAIAWTGVLFAISAWWALVYTHYVVLLVPPFVVAAVHGVVASSSRRRVIGRVVTSVCAVLFAMSIAGVTSYLLGFFGNTAVVLSPEAYDWSPRSLRPIAATLVEAILPQSGLGSLAPVAIGLILVCIAAALRASTRSERELGALGLMAMVIMVGYRILERLWSRESGPPSAYVTWVLFPFLMCVVAFGLQEVVQWIRWHLPRRGRAALGGVLLVALLAHSLRLPSPNAEDTQRSNLKDSLGRHLGAIRLYPGGEFRGRAVFMPRVELSTPLDAEVTAPFAEAMTLRLPLLNQHSHLQTPAFVSVIHELLARPNDPQRRAHLTLRKPDRRLLDLFGVRFVVTDVRWLPQYGGGRRISDFAATIPFGSAVLFESDTFNDGSYSPTTQVVVPGYSSAVATLHRDDFDPRHDVVLMNTELPPLVPVTSARLLWDDGELVVEAKSPGDSLLVLPWEYSRCWRVTSVGGGVAAPTLIPVDAVLLGIHFRERLEATIRFDHHLLFGWRDCRILDALSFEELRDG